MLTKIKLFALLICVIFSIADADILECDYLETVDLTDSQRFSNGSYLYEKLLIPAELTGEYNYTLLENGEREDVPKHMRGCACKLKRCVRFCCHHSLQFENGECIGQIDKEIHFDPYINVTLNNGTVMRGHVLDEFVVQRHLPILCKQTGHYPLDNRKLDEGWILHESGILNRLSDSANLTKMEYCLQPLKLDPGHIELVPHNCLTLAPKQWPTIIVFGLTLICLLLTIGVYLFLPSLRTLHGKCFICYLICLFTGYFFKLLELLNLSASFCSLGGYVGYFAIMAAFFWLSVISLDLYNCFRGTTYNVQRYTPRNRFLIYNLYAWGMASLLTTLIVLLDGYIPITEENEHLLPGVGYYSCWIKTLDWSAMMYFFGPMMLLIIFNTSMFILTAARIMVVKKELQNIVARQERQQKLNSDKQTYSFFLRLFIIMGVSWSLEIVSYLVQGNEVLEKLFLVSDYFNAAQGIVIFILFVLKRSVLKLFLDRIRGKTTEDDINNSEEEISLQERKDGPNILF